MIYFVGLGIHLSKQQTLAGPQCAGNRAEQLGSFSLSWEPLLVCYLSHLQARPSSIAMTWTPRSILSPPMASHPSTGISGLDLPGVLHLCIQLLSLQDSMDQKKIFFNKNFYYFRPLILWKFIFLYFFLYLFILPTVQHVGSEFNLSMWGPEINLKPLAVKAQRLNHCTTRKFSAIYLLEQLVLS